jgi:hypothetical protein
LAISRLQVVNSEITDALPHFGANFNVVDRAGFELWVQVDIFYTPSWFKVQGIHQNLKSGIHFSFLIFFLSQPLLRAQV